MILVTGATGTTGSALVRLLLARGHEVTAVTRDSRRIRPREGLTVSTTIVPARALYLVAPAGPGIPDHDRANLEAAHEAGIRRVVKLSAIGTPETPVPPTQLGAWHQPGEEAVRTGGFDWTILRPTTFASNSLAWVDDVRQGRPVPNVFGDGKQGVVDPADVAAVAVEALATGDHDGRIYTLTGPELISVPEQVAQLGEVIGRPGSTVEAPLEDAGVFAQGARLVREGGNAIVTGDVELVLGRRPKSYRAWAEDNRERLRAGAPPRTR